MTNTNTLNARGLPFVVQVDENGNTTSATPDTLHADLAPTMSTGRLLSVAASTNSTNVKASAGRVYAIQGYNAANAVRYFKLYNKATAPTVGTDTPVKTLALPPGVGFAFDWSRGYAFATGIGFGLTTGAADNDTGALTAADVLGINVDYV